MEKKSEGSFARKVRNRKFAIDNSWKNDSLQLEDIMSAKDIVKQEEHDKWTLLQENLAEANESKFYDGYPTISSNGKRFGKVIVFVKRAIRKVIKHTLGWYIFPFYQRFSHFAGKMVNVASLEREFIYAQQEQLNKLSATVTDLANQIGALTEKIQLLSNEAAEKNYYLYTEIAAAQQNEQEISDRICSLENKQKSLMLLIEGCKEKEEALDVDVQSIRKKQEKVISKNAENYSKLQEKINDSKNINSQLTEEIVLIKKLFTAKEEQLTDEIILTKKLLSAKEEQLNDEITATNKLFASTKMQLTSRVDELQETTFKQLESLQENSKQLNIQTKELQKITNEQLEALRETDLWLNNEMLENRKKVDAHEVYISNETWTENDSFYHDFEEYFRGERSLIKQRQEQYVPIVKSYLPDWSKCKFVDIGSGRGEWLDILKENGATAYVGIDINERQNQISRSFGHCVLNENCITYLESLKNNSVDVISGFQIIEHLSRKDLQELFKQCNRVLKQGGMILFETPNPQNVEVGANTFYLDPTHNKPLNPLYVQYLVERSGFGKAQIIYSSSNFNYDDISEEDKTVFSEQLTDRVLGAVNMLYGPKDYCILAIKE